MANKKSKLRAARKLIEKPERWTTGAWALDKDGFEVEPDEPSARRWCAEGACMRVMDDNLPIALSAAAKSLFGQSVFRANDTHSHADALTMFDWAIAFDEVGLP